MHDFSYWHQLLWGTHDEEGTLVKKDTLIEGTCNEVFPMQPQILQVFLYPGEPNTFTQFHNKWESSLLNLIIFYPVCAFLFWTYLNFISCTESIPSQHEKKQILETK